MGVWLRHVFLAAQLPGQCRGRTSQTQNWQEAFAQVAGEHAVLTGEGTANQLERKGYKPIKAPENLIRAAEQYGVQTPGRDTCPPTSFRARDVVEPTPDAQAAVDLVWEWLEEVRLTQGKAKPPVKCFTSILDGGVMLNGFYRDGTVFINSDLCRGWLDRGRTAALSDRLVHVALEETAHFVTNATDNSRDFQNFLLDLAVKLGRQGWIRPINCTKRLMTTSTSRDQNHDSHRSFNWAKSSPRLGPSKP